MTAYAWIERAVEPLAVWAMEYRSPEHHDSDVVASMLGVDVTVGLLRRAFEQYFGLPFGDYQHAPDSPAVRARIARARRCYEAVVSRGAHASGGPSRPEPAAPPDGKGRLDP